MRGHTALILDNDWARANLISTGWARTFQSSTAYPKVTKADTRIIGINIERTRNENLRSKVNLPHTNGIKYKIALIQLANVECELVSPEFISAPN